MFVTAISSKGVSTYKPGDAALGGEVGDLSPASFRVMFDEPLQIKNADIELVSCSVKKQNNINIDADSNTFTVRMGTFETAEQYLAKIPSGNYEPDNLATEMAKALNKVMPTPMYRGWSGSVVLDKIVLTYTVQDAPTIAKPSNFQTAGKNTELSVERGVQFPNKTDDTGSGAGANYIKYECSDETVNTNYNSWNVPANVFKPKDSKQLSLTYERMGGNDLGRRVREAGKEKTNTDIASYQSVDEFGVYPAQKQKMSVVLRPVECIVASSFDRGYGGFDLAGADKPTYLTYEFEDYKSDAGVVVSGDLKYGSLFTKQTYKYNKPRAYSGQKHQQINGVLNLAYAGKDFRGSPYSDTKTQLFPYSVDSIKDAGVLNDAYCRKLPYDTTWSGQMVTKAGQGRPKDFDNSLPENPISYTFQIGIEVDNKKASSICKRRGFETEKVKVRLSNEPFIQGLKQQTSLNATGAVDTNCIIVVPYTSGSTQTLQYKVGSTGQFNSRANGSFGGDLLDNNKQFYAGNNGEGDIYKPAYYKILSINANGSPNRVVLVDSGEHTKKFDGSTADLKLDTSLFLNDPNTFDIKLASINDDETNLKEQIWRCEPEPAHIGAKSFLETKKQPRYATFSAGLQRDDIFQNNKEYNTPKGFGNVNNPFNYAKDFEVSLTSRLEDTQGQAVDVQGQIYVSCNQLIPTQSNDSYYTKHDMRADVKKVIFNGASDKWANKNIVGDGTQLVNWTTFTGVGNADNAIELSIDWKDVNNMSCSIAHCINYVDGATNSFTESVVLCETGTTRAGSNIKKMEATLKSRFHPYHPVWTALPCSTVAKNVVRVLVNGTDFPNRDSAYFGGESNYLSNYACNLAFMAKCDSAYQAPQNVFPPTSNVAPPQLAPPGERPVMMVKTNTLHSSQISAGPAPPPAGSQNFVIKEDFVPEKGGSLFNAGLFSVQYGIVPAFPVLEFNFKSNLIPPRQAFLPSYAVEIQNLPLNGYYGKGFDLGLLSQRKGLGSRLPIVGVVPAGQVPVDALDPIVNYAFKSNYYQPTQVRLPTRQFLTYLDINLRSILTGKLLNDLLHSTEIIFRIYSLPDELENNALISTNRA